MGFDGILVERMRIGQSARELEELSVFATTADGHDVIKLEGGTTEWSEPVRGFRAGEIKKAQFDPSLTASDPGFGTLKDPVNSTSAIQAGRLLVVRPADDLTKYALVKVAGTSDGNELLVSEPDVLAKLMDGYGVAIWREIVEVAAEHMNATDCRLVTINPVTADPSGVTLFAAADAELPAEVVFSSGQSRTLVLRGWGGSPSSPGDLVKIVSEEASEEVMQVKSLLSSFLAPELSWEYFNGEGWKLLDKGFGDTTADLTRSGKVSFSVPADLKQSEISGQEDYWIRARLVDGDYGKPVYKISESAGEQKVIVDTSDLYPPQVARVTAHFEREPEKLPELVVAQNNLRDLDQTSANKLAGASYAMFAGADAAPLGDGGGRAIMLGMSRPIEPGLVTFFVTVREQDREAKLILEILGPDNSWAPATLSGEDSTRGLHRTGRLRFTVAERPARVMLFGKTLCWLRMRVEGLADWAPQITGIWLNGVKIVQAETVRQELLGSSVGEPNLQLTLSNPPVLANSLELRVKERLSSEEIAKLNAAREEGAPMPVLNEVPNLSGIWVLWQQVDSLREQTGATRAYQLNPDGRLRFGDGQGGRIVPAGRDNIRAFSYQSGGQRVETAAFAEAGLTGSVEGVETVLAPAPIAGGTHPAQSKELVARMPEALRHAGQGLSLSDLEALARDTDSEIVQVRALAPDTPGGVVSLIVLARGEEDIRKPEYSLAQADNLRRELGKKMSDAFGPACLEVRKAAFVEVQVEVNLMARPGALAALETDALDCLRTFLHPALGGPDWNGWPPGRGLWPTDIRRALSKLKTLDRVLSVEIVMPDGRSLGDVHKQEVITAASVRDVKVLVKGEAET
jgi:hypothetical protein